MEHLLPERQKKQKKGRKHTTKLTTKEVLVTLKSIQDLLAGLINDLKTELSLLVSMEKPGKHLIIKNERSVIRYCMDDRKTGTRTYINTKEKDKLREYCQDRFRRTLERKLPGHIAKLEKAAGILEKAKDIQQMYEELSEPVKKYATPRLLNEKKLIENFYGKARDALRSSYEKGSDNRTDRGEYVRSKSELIIANMLFREGIPYDYERPVVLKNGKIKYPDFTVLNTRTGREYIFEHFGKLDNEEYRFKNLEKIKDYENSGYIQGINLIMSFETKDNPLDTTHIRNLIEAFFK